MRVTVDNQGSEAHQVELVRIVDDATPADILAAIQRMDVVALNEMVTYHGGPNEVPVSESRSVVTQLESGHYVLLCFVSSPDGQLHVLKGMIGSMEITEPGAPVSWDPPEAKAVVTLENFRFDVSGELSPGSNLVLVRNEGAEPHEFRVYDDGGPGGGSSTISPGTETWVEMMVEPGSYSFVCHVPLSDGSGLHINLGMVSSIRVP